MKYPECCYRIGNEFEQSDKHRMKLGELHEGNKEWTLFDQHVSFRGYHEYWTQRHLESATIVSITAETLAELARENKETTLLRFKAGSCRARMWSDEHEETFFQGLDDNAKSVDEPLGEFFLRVAKERKYID